MRRAARIDANQQLIVHALRQAGASVHSLASEGSGCPDILVGFRQRNYLLEIKDGNKPPSARALTADEKEWHAGWHGQVAVVESVEEALTVVGIIRGNHGKR